MVYKEEDSQYSEYWTKIVKNMSGDIRIDNVVDRQDETVHDENVPDNCLTDELLSSETENEEEYSENMKTIDNNEEEDATESSNKRFQFKGGNSEIEKEYSKKIKIEFPNDFDEAKKISKTIRLWLQVMDKTLDYVYNYEMPPSNDFDVQYEALDNCVWDPFISLDTINENTIDEMISTTSNKRMKTIQGKCLLRLKDGTDVIGSWQNGKRNGQGSVSGPFLDKLGVRMVAGNYSDGVLTGVGRIHMNDGSIRDGWFCQGRADGPFKGFVKGSGLVWLGHYAQGVPVGITWQAVLGGAWLVGQLDISGQMTGSDVAFLYPDLKTALVGEFRNGELVSAVHSRVISLREDSGLLFPKFEKLSKTEFRQWPSSRFEITSPPHLRDPYEDQLVEVGTSKVSGGGDGLFAKVDIPAGTLVAYYHGLRMTAGDAKLCEKSSGYSIYLEWDTDLRKTSDVLDIAPQYQSTENYTSTLAHKTNHSFQPNCEWVHAQHPCYGKIPAVFTQENVKQGEEISIHYGYAMDVAPQWYVDFWRVTE